jgi:hypothetical protein
MTAAETGNVAFFGRSREVDVPHDMVRRVAAVNL